MLKFIKFLGDYGNTYIMKANSLFKALVLSSAFCTGAYAVTVEKSLENGFDSAIVDAFKDTVSSTAIDDISQISLNDIKAAVSSVKIDSTNLVVNFDDEKLSSLLASKGIASWNGLTEPVLVWIANVSESGLAIMGGDNEFEFAKALNEASNRNSYNLMFPLMDLDDMQAVNAQTVLSHSDSQLVKASKRYDAKYFVAGAVEYNPVENSYQVKWNAYDAEGNNLGSGDLQGELVDVTSTMSRDVARVLMQNKPQSEVSQTSADEAQNVKALNADGSITLGPVAGGVRVMITNINNVADYPKIQRTLITYGYEADIAVLGYNDSGVIFMIPTGSSPAILDGTLTHASEFSKVGEWVYSFNNSIGSVSADENIGTISRKTSTTVTSDLNGFGGKAFVEETVETTVEETVTAPKAQENSGAEIVTLQ